MSMLQLLAITGLLTVFWGSAPNEGKGIVPHVGCHS